MTPWWASIRPFLENGKTFSFSWGKSNEHHSVRLPLELLHQILLHLISHNDTFALDILAFSLVCTDWHIAARHLLPDITTLEIDSSLTAASLNRLANLLTSAHNLQLQYTTSTTTIHIDFNIFCSKPRYIFRWRRPKLVAIAIRRLLSVPSFNRHTLYLSNIANYHSDIFRFACDLPGLLTNISTLHLNNVDQIIDGPLELPIADLITSLSSTLHTIHLANANHGRLIRDALGKATCLKHITISYDNSFNFPLPVPSMPEPAHATIDISDDFNRTLQFDFDPDAPRDYPHVTSAEFVLIFTVSGIIPTSIRCCRLKSLTLRGNNFWCSSMLNELARKATRLERLKFEFFSFANLGVLNQCVGENLFPALRVLEISSEVVGMVDHVRSFVDLCPTLLEVRIAAPHSKQCSNIMQLRGFASLDVRSETVVWKSGCDITHVYHIGDSG